MVDLKLWFESDLLKVTNVLLLTVVLFVFAFLHQMRYFLS